MRHLLSVASKCGSPSTDYEALVFINRITQERGWTYKIRRLAGKDFIVSFKQFTQGGVYEYIGPPEGVFLNAVVGAVTSSPKEVVRR